MAVRELFVWYRVATERVDAARAAVLAMQRSLQDAWPGLQARLLVRDDAAIATWMETYARPASPRGRPGIDERIEADIAAAAGGLDALIEGERHVEAFELLG
jgi:uncharacterized protein DUF4936